MSGAHRVVKPPRSPRFVWLLAPVRLAVRYTQPAWRPIAAGCRRLADWAETRFDNRDPWENDPAASPTPATPVPAELPAPTQDQAPNPKPEPLHLTPTEAFHYLQMEHPHLPAHLLAWRVTDDTLLAEVRALDCTPVEQRAVVYAYAYILNVGAAERETNDGHIILSALGEYAGVTVLVQATQLRADRVPLPAYADTAQATVSPSTLETQVIPDEVLQAVTS